MARSRNRSERDANVIASPEFDRLLRPNISPVVTIQPAPTVSVLDFVRLPEVEDLRTWSPEPVRTPLTVQGVASSYVRSEPPRGGAALSGRLFSARPQVVVDSSRVVMCVRRKQRREVLFAKKRTRAGAGARRKRNIFSDIGC